LDRVNENLIYEAFRKFLTKSLRPLDEETVHVGEVVQCLRKSFYTRRFGSKELTHLEKTKFIILGLGLSTHLVLEEVLKELGCATEFTQIGTIVTKDYQIRIAGTPDAFNDKFVIEIKTVNKIPEKPYKHHLMQLNAYLWLTHRRIGYIVYIEKKTGRVKVFEHTFNDELHDEFIRRAIKYYEAIKYNITPEREESFLCNYCEWKFMCYESKAKESRRKGLNNFEGKNEYGERKNERPEKNNNNRKRRNIHDARGAF